jgi:predicted RNA-binding Zn-ribbon protein involved in translation (DUF1610 family)
MGRGIIVTQKVKRGELLLAELPLDLAMDEKVFSRRDLLCHSCAINIAFRVYPCPDCATSWYCSTECRNADRQRHKLMLCSTPLLREGHNIGRLGCQLYFASKFSKPETETLLKVENEKEFPKGTVKNGFYQGTFIIYQTLYGNFLYN